MGLKFSCRLSFTQSDIEGEPDSGEKLIAQTWENGNHKITVGTEDEQALLERSENEKGLPLRFAKENLLIPEIIEYLNDGIQITLPTLQENEEGQVQFVIAWIENSDRNDSSTWLAVDRTPEQILEQGAQS